MADETYNGWTNYETWAVKLWIDNEEHDQNYWLEQARDIQTPERIAALRNDYNQDVTAERLAVWNLAEQLKDEHQEGMPEVTGVFSDLMSHSLGRVDWYAIAESLIEDAAEIND